MVGLLIWVSIGLVGYYYGPYLKAEKDTDTREMVWLAIGYMIFGPTSWIGNFIVNAQEASYKSKSEKSTLPRESSTIR
jgi:hypothetical protein